MPPVSALWPSFLAAAVAPTLVASLYFAVLSGGAPDVAFIALLAFAIAAAHVIVLGIPSYVLLRRIGLLRWWSLTALGYVAGCIPVAIFLWPLRYAGPGSSSQENGVWTMIDGIPTTAGWLRYAGSVALLGMLGAVGAIAFWFSHKRLMRSNSSLERTPDR